MSALSPEQQRAWARFYEQYVNYMEQRTVPISWLTLDGITTTDALMFVQGKVNRKSLPHEFHWAWNQSKSKVYLDLDDGGNVKFAKLNPRRVKPTSDGLPSYKLWVFEIESPKHGNNQPLYFLWCEKGKISPHHDPPLVQEANSLKHSNEAPTTPSDDLRLEHYAFLADFIDPQIASELGWSTPSPKHSPTN